MKLILRGNSKEIQFEMSTQKEGNTLYTKLKEEKV